LNERDADRASTTSESISLGSRRRPLSAGRQRPTKMKLKSGAIVRTIAARGYALTRYLFGDPRFVVSEKTSSGSGSHLKSTDTATVWLSGNIRRSPTQRCAPSIIIYPIESWAQNLAHANTALPTQAFYRTFCAYSRVSGNAFGLRIR
jgi:hypothetical protein